MFLHLKLFESVNAETMDVEGQLCTQNRQGHRAKYDRSQRGFKNPTIRH